MENHFIYNAWKMLKDGIEKERDKIILSVKQGCIKNKYTTAARNVLLTFPNIKKNKTVNLAPPIDI